MTTLYLVRHAHAEWQPDEARPLSAQGLAAAELVADLLSTRPIAAIYSSPARRAIDTVAPLARRVGVPLAIVPELRERDLPTVAVADFDRVVREHWQAPTLAIDGRESNSAAQTRGRTALREILARHDAQHVVVATHGNLLALMLNGLDPSFGYDFWRQLSFPDVYELDLDGGSLAGVRRHLLFPPPH